jgi:hypothetical protein
MAGGGRYDNTLSPAQFQPPIESFHRYRKLGKRFESQFRERRAASREPEACREPSLANFASARIIANYLEIRTDLEMEELDALALREPESGGSRGAKVAWNAAPRIRFWSFEKSRGSSLTMKSWGHVIYQGRSNHIC